MEKTNINATIMEMPEPKVKETQNCFSKRRKNKPSGFYFSIVINMKWAIGSIVFLVPVLICLN